MMYSASLQRLKSLFGIMLVLLQAAVVFAQESMISFDHLFLQHGLSQSIVNCVLQSQDGYLWIATEEGLNKYDGYEFTVFRHEPDNPYSLSYNEVTALCEDQRGYIWVGTFSGGLNRFDKSRERFTRYMPDRDNANSVSHVKINALHLDRSDRLWIGTDGGLDCLTGESSFVHYRNRAKDRHSLSHNTVKAICADSWGRLWVGTDRGLNLLDAQRRQFQRYLHDPRDPNSLAHDSILSLYIDKQNRLWIGSNGGGLDRITLADSAADRLVCRHYRHKPGQLNSLPNDQVACITQDRDGLYWIATANGLSLFDADKEIFDNYYNDALDARSVSSNEIRHVYEDRSGLLWIGTYSGGLDRINRNKKMFKTYRHETGNPDTPGHNIIWAFYEDSDSVIWIGTHNGLDRWDRRHNRFRHYRHSEENPHSLSHNVVRVILRDRDGHYWIGTNGGGLSRFDPRTERFVTYRHHPRIKGSLAHDEIRAIYQDRRGDIWIGTYGGGLDRVIPSESPRFLHYRFSPARPAGLSSDYIRAIFEDRQGELWIATQGGGLNRLNRERDAFTHFRKMEGDSTGLNTDFTFCIHEDRRGDLWFGTWGGGVNKFEREKNNFIKYTVKDGLLNNSVYAILEDSLGCLWMTTNAGISRFDPQTGLFRNFTVDDGLQSNEFNGGASLHARTGEFFFGGIAGFNVFFPQEIRDNPFIPPIVITAFRKMNQRAFDAKLLSAAPHLQLDHRDYFFSFDFSALDFTAPKKNQYAYKMEGLDPDWIRTDANKRTATFTTLAPGDYVFRVKGSNADGVWNEAGCSIPITILPPYWQTWYFRLAAALVVIGLIFFLLHRHLRTVAMKSELAAAHHAQMSIMPAADPQVPGFDISGICLPANEVGGDFFDFFWFGQTQNRFGIAIGDVSGKAMESAMTAVMASGMIYAKIDEDLSISEIMSRLNRPMFLKTERKMFTALCLAALDIQARTFIFTNAGLIEPMLVSERGVTSLAAGGSSHPLGLVEKFKYQEHSVNLHGGDVIVLCTDGITEAFDSDRKPYGEERLQRLLREMNTTELSSAAVKAHILADVHRFTGNTSQHDDMTVVVIKVV